MPSVKEPSLRLRAGSSNRLAVVAAVGAAVVLVGDDIAALGRHVNVERGWVDEQGVCDWCQEN